MYNVIKRSTKNLLYRVIPKCYYQELKQVSKKINNVIALDVLDHITNKLGRHALSQSHPT